MDEEFTRASVFVQADDELRREQQALRAKGVLMLRESGFEEPPLDDDVKAQIAELHYLERSLGKSGQLALRPIVMATGKDLWQLQWLEH